MTDVRLEPAARVRARVRVPGDKSISHRALILNALGSGSARVEGLAPGEDVASTIHALRALGVRIERLEDGAVVVEGASRGGSASRANPAPGDGGPWASRDAVDCGNSGTTARLLLGVLAPRAVGPVTLTGDASLRARPMARVVEPLRRMGARVQPASKGGAMGGADPRGELEFRTPGQEGGADPRGELEFTTSPPGPAPTAARLPLTITGQPLTGRTHRLDVASAQVESALLLAGLEADGDTVVVSPGASRDHTPRMLAAMGARIAVEPLGEGERDATRELPPGARRVTLSPGPVGAIDVSVPGDLSSAAFPLALAAALPGSEIVVENVGLNPGRTGFLEILEAMGAEVEADVEATDPEPRGTVRVAGRGLVGIEVDPALVPRAIDELPLVAVLGAVAEGTTRVTGAAELKVKESDRIAAIAAGLVEMGAAIETVADGFAVHGPVRLAGARLDAAGDHRIGMALAIAALLARGPSTLSGAEWIHVSWPGFLPTVTAIAAGAAKPPASADSPTEASPAEARS